MPPKKKNLADPRDYMRFDLVVKKVPYKDYLKLRKQLMDLGFEVQGYQDGYYEDTKRQRIDE